jgi:hypothetical protein
MWRELYLFLELAAVLTVLRLAIMFFWEQKQRFTFKRQFGESASTTVEIQIASWKKKKGRWLWINMVGLPLLVFFVILYIANLG